jgi:hypothetical protein
LDLQDSRAREDRPDLLEQVVIVERLVELELPGLQDPLEQLVALVLRVEPAIPGRQAHPAHLVNRVSRGLVALPGLPAIVVPLESRELLASRGLRVSRVRKVKLDL